MISQISPQVVQGVEDSPQQKASDAKMMKAARDFEAIFVRKILSSLEKSSHGTGTGGSLNAGEGMYGSMMVGALADAIAGSGGLGLAEQFMQETRARDKSLRNEPLAEPRTISTQGSGELSAQESRTNSK